MLEVFVFFLQNHHSCIAKVDNLILNLFIYFIFVNDVGVTSQRIVGVYSIFLVRLKSVLLAVHHVWNLQTSVFQNQSLWEGIDFLSALVGPECFGGFLLQTVVRTSPTWAGTECVFLPIFNYSKNDGSRACYICTYCTSHKHINTYTTPIGAILLKMAAIIHLCQKAAWHHTYHCLKADSAY